MKESEALDLFRRVGAIITDSHIVYTSGKHGREYINKDAVYPYPGLISTLCHSIADETRGFAPDAVVAPALGGIILSQWTAYHLTNFLGRDVLAVYAEKAGDGKAFLIKRGYDKLIKGKQVLVVEDVLTTGGSVKAVVDLVREIGGVVVGVGALVNRGGITSGMLMVPQMRTLVQLDMETFEEVNCPLCKDNVPINTDVGKGREFLARKAPAAS